MCDRKATSYLVSGDDIDSQEDEGSVTFSHREARSGGTWASSLGKASFAIGLVVALVGSAHFTNILHLGERQAAAAEVRVAVGLASDKDTPAEKHEKPAEAATYAPLPQCFWRKMEQQDFPEHGKEKSVKYTDFTDVSEVQRYAEEHGFVGFALRNNVAYLKGGDNAPRSWRDLLWMGSEHKVDFYLCEDPQDMKGSEETEKSAQEVLDEYVSEETKGLEGQWVGVHAVPEDAGEELELDFSQDAKSVHDMQVLCGANEDCVGFAYSATRQKFSAKKKYTGFFADTAKYKTKELAWALGPQGESCDQGCRSMETPHECASSIPEGFVNSISTTASLGGVMKDLGGDCQTFDVRFGGNNDVPNWDATNNECFAVNAGRSTYDCGGIPSPSTKRRLCLCVEADDWVWYFLKSRAVDPDAPPPAQACPTPDEDFNLPHKSCPDRNDPSTCLMNNINFATFEDAWEACGHYPECALVLRSEKFRYFLRRSTDPDFAILNAASMRYTCREVASCSVSSCDYVKERECQCNPQCAATYGDCCFDYGETCKGLPQGHSPPAPQKDTPIEGDTSPSIEVK